ncbi:hypothetical protein C8R45DRAFT_634088 [Mycena sanguinolenta]|nr:hypothetical protein C8R45DRAFT_634088 [Mycena sanguinolenta]
MRKPIDYQHLVPTEVWIACWAFCTSRQLRRISVVCRHFRSLTVPSLFQHQALDVKTLVEGLTPDNWIDHFHHLHRIAVRLDSLATSPFPALVRSWRVTFSYSPLSLSGPQMKHTKLFDAMQDRATSTFFSTLGLYRNISSLHIEISRIGSAAWETLLCLPLLQTLHIEAVHIDMGNQSSALTGSQTHYGLVAPRKLQSLHLTYARHLLDAFSASELCHLVHLSIQAIRLVQDMEPFVRFVEQCPRLESITVDTPSPRRPSPLKSIDVRPGSLPLLHTLGGPSFFVRSLVPGRPIRSVRVVEHELDLDDLLSLCVESSRSTVPVQPLTLPRTAPTLEFLQRILALFPEVSELYLAIKDPPPSVISCHWSREPVWVVDQRTPVFCDAEAFDGLPAEELSDY